MSDTYNIFDEEEMNKTISISECRNLKKVLGILACAPMITKKEYVRLMVVFNGILRRMEEEVVS